VSDWAYDATLNAFSGWADAFRWLPAASDMRHRYRRNGQTAAGCSRALPTHVPVSPPAGIFLPNLLQRGSSSFLLLLARLWLLLALPFAFAAPSTAGALRCTRVLPPTYYFFCDAALLAYSCHSLSVHHLPPLSFPAYFLRLHNCVAATSLFCVYLPLWFLFTYLVRYIGWPVKRVWTDAYGAWLLRSYYALPSAV